MPELQIIMGGYSINTDQTRLGLCTVTLIRGETLSIVDVAHFGRRNMLVDQLAANGISVDDIGRVILTHAHWDHSQNTTCFRMRKSSFTPTSWSTAGTRAPATWRPPAISPTRCWSRMCAPCPARQSWSRACG